MCDFLASAVLSGMPSRDALSQLVDTDRLPHELATTIGNRLRTSEPFAGVVSGLRADLDGGEHRELGVLLATCVTDGGFVVAALSQAAGLFRSNAALSQQVAVLSAHSRLTRRVLTALPLGFLAVGTALSASFRDAVATPTSLVCLVFSAALNGAGRKWMNRITDRARPSDSERDAYLLATWLCVSLRAGHTLVDACRGLGAVNHCGREVATLVDNGCTLDVALEPLARHHGDSGDALRRAILDCTGTGLPLAESAARIAEATRQRQVHAVSVCAQQLSTRTSMPVVLCMLPSFALAVLMPLLMASVTSLAARG